jgi:hypothetical protein
MTIERTPSIATRVSRAKALMAVCLTAILLAACGGGGGDDSGGNGGGGGSTVGGSSGGGGTGGGGTGGGGTGGGGTGGGGTGGGGTGGGGTGGGGGSGGLPSIQSSPQSTTVVVGQDAVFRVEVGDTTGLLFEWQERRDQQAWAPATGHESTQSTSSELRVAGLGQAAGTYYRVLIRNAIGEVASAEARLDVVWGTVETLEPNTIDFNAGGDGPGAGDGGTSGGGDGDGVGAGGGLGKTLRVEIAVARTADGASLGRALTGEKSGLVRIKAAPGTAPVLLTLSGTDVGTYYDEGRSALVPYGPDQPPMHALVTEFDQHLGVTALTEAAYRYAINHFIADPDAIRNGSARLRQTATADEIARLTPAQIRQAHEAIRAEINRKLPERYQLLSIATLPTPVDGSSGRGTITNNRYGVIQAVTGGLALLAGRFDTSLARPALTITAQLGDDLTDGVIDGLRLDGTSVFANTSAAYDPLTFARDLVAAADALLDLLASIVPLPTITVQPTSITITEGGLATLSVHAEGDWLRYQWFAGEQAIAGAQSPNYSTRTPGSYRVVVSNGAGAVSSTPASISISIRVVAPLITKQPVSLTISLGRSGTFSVEATGTDLEYQWFHGTTLLERATTAILNTRLLGTYHVVVRNSAGSVRSNDATLLALPLLGAPPAPP